MLRIIPRIHLGPFKRMFGTSFYTLAQEHKILASNLQKIAEADRKFVSFEVSIL